MTERDGALGVMLMAYGAPASLDEVEAYYTDIRGGRKPPPEKIEELRGRYRRIGGLSPLLAITRAQARALEAELAREGPAARVFVGMRHARPFVRDSAEEAARAGVHRLVGLALAPHYSAMSVGAYHRALQEAVAGRADAPELLLVDSYHDHPLFVAALAEKVRDAARGFGSARERLKAIFTAHSLPRRLLDEGDPYRDQLLESSRLVAGECGGLDWTFAFQSASETGEPWLGPDVKDALRGLAAEGQREVLLVPIGFVADHLEVLYDLDHECRELAKELGLRLRRTESLNASPAFVRALAAVVRERASAG